MRVDNIHWIGFDDLTCVQGRLC